MAFRIRMMRFLTFSVMLHFGFAGLSELVFQVNPPGPPRDPISVTLVKSRPLPNEDLEAGKIIDTRPPKVEELPDETEKVELAEFDSRAHAPKINEQLLYKDISVPKKKMILPDKQAVVGPKTRPATSPEPILVERPGESSSENPADDFPNPFLEAGVRKEPLESEQQKVKFPRELERLTPDPKLQTGMNADAAQPKKEPQDGERLLSGEEVDFFIANNPDTYLETKDELVVSLNSRKFRYMAYFSKIRRALETVWFYPEKAMSNGLGGQAQVRFTISEDGSLVETKVITTSGEDVLDRASIMAIKGAGPFPPFPESLQKKRVHIVATFSYRPIFSAVP
jgi:protein TonB